MYRIKVSSLVMAILLFSFTWREALSEGGERAAKLETLAVASASGGGAATVDWYLGMEKGFFQKEGISIDIFATKGLIRMAGLKAGNINYSIEGADSFWAIATGFPARVTFVTGSRRPNYLITKPEIKDFRALKGKTIGVNTAGDSENMAIDDIAKQFGLAPGDITVISLGPGMIKFQSLVAGSVDGVLVGPPVNFLAEDKGFKKLLNIYDYFPTTNLMLVTRDDAIKKNRDQVKRMLRATVRSHLYVLGNKEDVVDFLIRSTSSSRSVAERTYDAYKVNWTANGLVDEAAIQHELEVGRRMGITIPKTAAPSHLADFSILKEIHTELGLAK